MPWANPERPAARPELAISRGRVVQSSAVSGVFQVDEESYDDFMGRYSVRLAPLFADFAGVRAGQRVLDVGAGTGALTRELVLRGATVVAVEPSPEFIRALRLRFPMIEVRVAPGEELPFADDSFDTALARECRCLPAVPCGGRASHKRMVSWACSRLTTMGL